MDYDTYYCARYHDGGPGQWCVRGPCGFEMAIHNMDRSIGRIIAMLLSGKSTDAKTLLDTWCHHEAVMAKIGGVVG